MGGKEIKDSDRLGSIPENSWSDLKLEGIDLGPPFNVEVKVVHATSGRQAQVSVLDTSTIGDLKRAISAQLKATLANIRIVKRLAGGANSWQTLPDSEKLNGRIEFHCYCQQLEEPVFEDKVVVVIAIIAIIKFFLKQIEQSLEPLRSNSYFSQEFKWAAGIKSMFDEW